MTSTLCRKSYYILTNSIFRLLKKKGIEDTGLKGSTQMPSEEWSYTSLRAKSPDMSLSLGERVRGIYD